MTTKLWTAAAVILAVSGAAYAGEMSGSGGASNPASQKGVKTPAQPNETQPGMMSGAGDMKGEGKGTKGEKAAKGEKGAKGAKGSAKGEMKDDAMAGGTGMKAGGGSGGMSSGSSNMGNPAEKGVKTPSQPNETQPGMGGNKSK